VQGLQPWYAAEAADDIVVIDVHVQDSAGNNADVDDVVRWRDTYGLTFPVLADVDGSWAAQWGPAGTYSQRMYMVVGSDGLISWVQDDGSPGSADDLVDQVESAP